MGSVKTKEGTANKKDKLYNNSAKINAALRATATQETISETERGQAPRKFGKPPKSLIMQNDKVTNSVMSKGNEILYNQPYELSVGKRGKDNDVCISMIITNDETPTAEPLTLTRSAQQNQGSIIFSAYDEQVMNAVITFWESGNPQFTAAQIYRKMNGQTEKETPSDKCIKEVIESLNKLKSVICEIDATEEAKLKKYKDSDGKPITTLKIKGNLLAFDTLTYTKEDETETYKLFVLTCSPLLFRYASTNRQLITVPNKVLCICEVINGKATDTKIANSKQRIEIRGQLIKRIEIMKHDEKRAAESYRKAKPIKDQPIKPLASYRKQSRNINIENLFETLNITPERKTRKRHVDYILYCLEYWRSINYIRDYSMSKDKKTVTIII